MNNVTRLFTECERLGAELRPAPEGKLALRWIEPLPESLRIQLKVNKEQILATLRASEWLRAKLSIGPQRIGEVYYEWRNSVLHDPRALGEDLTQARWLLGIDAYGAGDGFMWWRLPPDKTNIQ